MILGIPNQMDVVHVVKTVKIIHAPLMVHVTTVLIRNTGRNVNRIAKPGVKTVYATEMAAVFLVMMLRCMGRHEPRREKTGFLHMLKKRRRSASR